MQTRTLIARAVGGLLSAAGAASVYANKAQETYLGKLEFQDQSFTRQTAEFPHRRMLQQRATQLLDGRQHTRV
jgi:hypothetical protein